MISASFSKGMSFSMKLAESYSRKKLDKTPDIVFQINSSKTVVSVKNYQKKSNDKNRYWKKYQNLVTR